MAHQAAKSSGPGSIAQGGPLLALFAAVLLVARCVCRAAARAPDIADSDHVVAEIPKHELKTVAELPSAGQSR